MQRARIIIIPEVSWMHMIIAYKLQHKWNVTDVTDLSWWYMSVKDILP